MRNFINTAKLSGKVLLRMSFVSGKEANLKKEVMPPPSAHVVGDENLATPWPELKGSVDVGSPARTRTADPVVSSHLLYPLSYRGKNAAV